MKNLTWITLIGLLFCGSIIKPLHAQTTEQLDKADQNSDGKIEWHEIVEMRQSLFKRLDRNSDGYVDKKDKPSFGPMKKRFNKALEKLMSTDKNNDERISKQELLEGPAPLFELGDIDKDGILSAEEIAQLRARDLPMNEPK